MVFAGGGCHLPVITHVQPSRRLRAQVGWVWGLLCLTVGLRRKAEQAFVAVLTHAPCHVQVLGSLAHLAAQAGRLEQALAFQRRCTELQPQSAAAWFNLGYLHEQCGQPQEAEAAFRQAVAVSPGLDQAWYALGLVLIQQGKDAEALLALAENTRLQPLSPHGWVLMARAQQRLGRWSDCLLTTDRLRGFDPKAAMALEREWQSVPHSFAAGFAGGAS